MIEILFHFGNDAVYVRIDGTNVFFGNTSQGAKIAPIQHVRLSREGVMKEFPDLRGDINWNDKAIERFKEHIKKLPTEEARADYIIFDLKKHGYVPKYKQKNGFRPEVIR